jgi:uncharacterized CHY-type Zn-finger protein
MVWHTVFDVMIPLYNFIKFVGRNETRAERRVYIPTDRHDFDDWLDFFAEEGVTDLSGINTTLLIERGILGVEKLERDARPDLKYNDSISFSYDFDRSTARGMREELLAFGGYPDWVPPNPLILIIDRAKPRDILNIPQIKEYISSNCYECNVEVVRIHELDHWNQVWKISQASVLIGFHGSGLTHVIWMAASAYNHMIEVLPYNYSCKNWYEVAARVAGVRYHPVMNRRPPKGADEDLRECWAKPEMCVSWKCHDKLRDQPTIVEMDTFAAVWDTVVDNLNYRALT